MFEKLAKDIYALSMYKLAGIGLKGSRYNKQLQPFLKDIPEKAVLPKRSTGRSTLSRMLGVQLPPTKNGFPPLDPNGRFSRDSLISFDSDVARLINPDRKLKRLSSLNSGLNNEVVIQFEKLPNGELREFNPLTDPILHHMKEHDSKLRYPFGRDHRTGKRIIKPVNAMFDGYELQPGWDAPVVPQRLLNAEKIMAVRGSLPESKTIRSSDLQRIKDKLYRTMTGPEVTGNTYFDMPLPELSSYDSLLNSANSNNRMKLEQFLTTLKKS